MYEKLSEDMERVIKTANVIAREYDQEYVGTEHLLLAIAREAAGRGAQLLIRAGATEAALKDAVDRLMQQSLEDTWVLGRLPGSPHFRNVIAAAIEEARAFESKEVRSEHLLLALLAEKGSVAESALTALGIRKGNIRAALREVKD